MHRLGEIKQRFSALSEESKTDLIGYLLFYFSEIARDYYIDAGMNPESSAVTLRAYNEIIQVLSKQLLVYLGAQPKNLGYPEDVFFEVLQECFEQGDASADDFIRSLYDAFRDVFQFSSSDNKKI